MATVSHEDDFSKRLFVAVHAGAGSHSIEKAADYKDLCRRACWQAMCLLRQKKSAVDAVTAAAAVLEDSELSNAGRGSNLTLTGNVECDASVMEGGSSLFGAVGCVSGVLNPVQVAHRLLQSQLHCSLTLGRVPPSVLVSSGAVDWAKQQGFSCEDHNKLITDNSKRLYRKYKRRVERAESFNTEKRIRRTDDIDAPGNGQFHCTHSSGPSAASPCLPNSHSSLPELSDFTNIGSDGTKATKTPSQNLCVKQNSASHGGDSNKSCRECNGTDGKRDVEDDSGDEGEDLQLEENPVQDTVGAVCVDWEGNVSAAVSSGGIWLKHPGRLGPAAMYGAGCWAQNMDDKRPGVAVITSGCGEHIMRTLLAKTCADCLTSAEDTTEGLRACFNQHFLESRLLSGVSDRLAGIVAVRITHTEENVPDVEVCWGHTTQSFALGYLRGDGHKPKTLISRLSEGCQAGKSFTMSSAFFS